MIKNVFIDIDNTLLDFEKCAKISMLEACDIVGIVPPENIFEVFTEINDSLWLAVERKEITKSELFAVRWNRIFARLGIDFDGPAFEKIFKLRLAESGEPVNNAPEILDYLNDKYNVYIASNSERNQQIKRLTIAGMYGHFDGMYVSGDIGHEKPSKEFFDGCFEKIGDIKKDETVMIGDSITADIKGGSEYGLKTVWYNHKNRPEKDGYMADYIIDDLIEIKNIL